jgi:hypothetical protein
LLRPFATRAHAWASEASIDTLKSVRVSIHNTPLQNNTMKVRRATSAASQYRLATQTKYTITLRFVSWNASHTFVRPVHAWNRRHMRSVRFRTAWSTYLIAFRL